MRKKKKLPNTDTVWRAALVKYPKLKEITVMPKYYEDGRERYEFYQRKGIVQGALVFTYYFDKNEIELHDQTFDSDSPDNSKD